MLSRTRLPPAGFIEPCLPSPAEHPPGGPGWIHEIKHDGFRLMARRDAAGVRLLTRNGIDWSGRFPLISEAAGGLKVRSCLIDGEAVACDGDGLPSFDRLRYRRQDGAVFLYAFDLLELDGRDLRREPLRGPQAPTRHAAAPRPLRAATQRAHHRARRRRFPPRLQTRVRGHRQQASGLALYLRAHPQLAQDEEPGGAGGKARGGGRVGLNPSGGASVANDEHVRLLKQGVAAWNAWRNENPDIRPNLSEASAG